MQCIEHRLYPWDLKLFLIGLLRIKCLEILIVLYFLNNDIAFVNDIFDNFTIFSDDMGIFNVILMLALMKIILMMMILKLLIVLDLWLSVIDISNARHEEIKKKKKQMHF